MCTMVVEEQDITSDDDDDDDDDERPSTPCVMIGERVSSSWRVWRTTVKYYLKMPPSIGCMKVLACLVKSQSTSSWWW